MEFTLFYRGELKANGSPEQKQTIRRFLHPQLKKLWDTELLIEYKPYLRNDPGDGDIGLLETVGEFTFAPLISSRLYLFAEVNIILLRPEEPGTIITQCGGDIDNRLKTLFDALAVPSHENQIPSSDRPKDSETPFFCLLQDDRLIKNVSVRTDRLLVDCVNNKEVVLLIQTRTIVRSVVWGNISFI
jgi:hypothetical protein